MLLKNRLNAEAVRGLAEKLLNDHLSIKVEGYKVTTSMVLNGLLKAAVEKRSIETVCADLANVVDSNTLPVAVNQTLKVEKWDQHEAEFNAALVACIPSKMPKQGLEMAIDCHDEPFYGHNEHMKAQQRYRRRFGIESYRLLG